MPIERMDCLVIGAGVIGLVIARALALAGRDVIVAEAASTVGTETSSRNSEVIHAGIYYTHPLKARLCVAGKQALYRYIETRGVPHRACGKLIVATEPAQIPALRSLAAQAAKNGVEDLRWLDPREARQLEPAVQSVGAFFSPSSGIIDSHALMLALQADAENAGAVFAFNNPVSGGEIKSDGILVEVGGDHVYPLLASHVINSAGLHAHRVAGGLRGFPPAHLPRVYYAKGNYFTLAGRSPFTHLVYPLPEQAGLGVHATIDLAERVRFGPDVEWVETIDYRVDPRRADSFYAAIRRYWPELPDEALQPDYAGIRPKLQAPGQPAVDFCIQGPETHGIPGLVNLFGMESPGLTACLAIADHVLRLLRSR